MTRTVDNSQDVLDSRDIIARIKELQDDRDGFADAMEEAAAALQEKQEALDGWEGADESEELLAARNEASKTFDAARNDLDEWSEDNAEELKALEALADEADGADDWVHGACLIRESYFTDYCMELVQDIGDLPKDIPRYLAIDWDKTADNLRVDYMQVDFDGVTYLVR